MRLWLLVLLLCLCVVFVSGVSLEKVSVDVDYKYSGTFGDYKIDADDYVCDGYYCDVVFDYTDLRGFGVGRDWNVSLFTPLRPVKAFVWMNYSDSKVWVVDSNKSYSFYNSTSKKQESGFNVTYRLVDYYQMGWVEIPYFSSVNSKYGFVGFGSKRFGFGDGASFLVRMINVFSRDEWKFDIDNLDPFINSSEYKAGNSSNSFVDDINSGASNATVNATHISQGSNYGVEHNWLLPDSYNTTDVLDTNNLSKGDGIVFNDSWVIFNRSTPDDNAFNFSSTPRFTSSVGMFAITINSTSTTAQGFFDYRAGGGADFIFGRLAASTLRFEVGSDTCAGDGALVLSNQSVGVEYKIVIRQTGSLIEGFLDGVNVVNLSTDCWFDDIQGALVAGKAGIGLIDHANGFAGRMRNLVITNVTWSDAQVAEYSATTDYTTKLSSGSYFEGNGFSSSSNIRFFTPSVTWTGGALGVAYSCDNVSFVSVSNNSRSTCPSVGKLFNYNGSVNGSSFIDELNVSLEFNGVPVVNNLVINSTLGTNTSVENLFANFTVSDAEGDSIVNYTRWYLNGSVQGGLNNVTLVGAGNLSVGDNWSVCVLGFDGFENGSQSCSVNLTVLSANTAPVVNNLVINSSTGINASNEFLFANFTVTDVDGDNVTNVTAWYLDGVLQGGLENLTGISGGNTSFGDNWMVCVTSNDGSVNSSVVCSANLSVLGVGVPSVTVGTPTSTYFISRVNLSVNYSYVDEEGENGTVSLFVDGAVNVSSLFVVNDSNRSLLANVSAGGVYSWFLNVVNVLNSSNTSTKFHIIDLVSPTFVDGTPSSVTQGNTLSIGGVVNDTHSLDVVTVQVLNPSNVTTNYSASLSGSTTNSSTSRVVRSTASLVYNALDVGVYNYSVFVFDEAGNEVVYNGTFTAVASSAVGLSGGGGGGVGKRACASDYVPQIVRLIDGVLSVRVNNSYWGDLKSPSVGFVDVDGNVSQFLFVDLVDDGFVVSVDGGVVGNVSGVVDIVVGSSNCLSTSLTGVVDVAGGMLLPRVGVGGFFNNFVGFLLGDAFEGTRFEGVFPLLKNWVFVSFWLIVGLLVFIVPLSRFGRGGRWGSVFWLLVLWLFVFGGVHPLLLWLFGGVL